jgi:hypothetical protein
MRETEDWGANCRHKAEQLRTIAAQVAAPSMRELLLDCADDYDKLAGQVFIIEFGKCAYVRETD